MKLFVDTRSIVLQHARTTQGIERFASDWQSRPEFADRLHGLVRSGAAAQ